MKRTEMIEILTELMRSIPSYASAEHKVDIILGKAERLGMLPPVTVMKSDPVNKDYLNEIISDMDMKCAWEEEYETERSYKRN